MADILQSFDSQKTLNPLIWSNASGDDFSSIKLIPEVRVKLFSVAKLFMEGIKLKNTNIQDIIFTGSLANYNWSEYSDIDLHIVVDKSKIDVDPETLDDYFTIKKDAFNSKHNIKIKGFDAELYIQGVDEEHIALGVYSIVFNRWLKEPRKDHIAIDKASIKLKVKGFIAQIQKVEQMIQTEENPEDIIAMINTLKDRIKKYRKSGLSDKGEYSDENLVFKYLRRTQYLQKLSDFKMQTIDRMFSLQELD